MAIAVIAHSATFENRFAVLFMSCHSFVLTAVLHHINSALLLSGRLTGILHPVRTENEPANEIKVWIPDLGLR
jgi:hypothetical protein